LESFTGGRLSTVVKAGTCAGAIHWNPAFEHWERPDMDMKAHARLETREQKIGGAGEL
jgi:hypothetical protein